MISSNETQGGPNSGQTISRAAALLRALSRAPQARRLTEIAHETGLTKPTALRLLRALQGEGFAFVDENGLWRPGLGLIALGAAAANRDGLQQLASQALTRIAEKSGDTVFFSLREGAEILCIDRREGAYPIRTLLLAPGQRRPLGVGAAGMAVLAFLEEDDRNASLRAIIPHLQEWPGHSPEQIEERVRASWRRGYALNDGQIMAAMWAVGVPVRDSTGAVVAALSVAAITERLKGSRLSEIVAMLREEVDAIEAQFSIDITGNSATPRIGPPVRQQPARGGRKASGRGR